LKTKNFSLIFLFARENCPLLGEQQTEKSGFSFGHYIGGEFFVELEHGISFGGNLDIGFRHKSHNVGPFESSSASILYSDVGLGIIYPIEIVHRIDIIPGLSLHRAGIKFEVNDKSKSDHDIGLSYGIGLRAWLMKDVIECSISLNDSTTDYVDTSVNLSSALWFHDNHSIRFNYIIQDERKDKRFAYRYEW
jgi:hypothetical protein